MPRISSGVEFRWPTSDDRLIRQAVEGIAAISFSEHPAERHLQISEGYFRAGHALVEVSETRTGYERQAMIYPILFCYRHALEMAMKWIIWRYAHEFGISDPGSTHNLWTLWRSCAAIFADADSENEANGTSIAGRLVKEFHDLDERSQAFRYAWDRDRVLIPLPDAAVDLPNLRSVMEGLENFFDGADSFLGEVSQFRNG